MDASGIGTSGVWMRVRGAYSNMVWPVEWPEDISRSVVSDKNPSDTITNSDLEMAAIILQWLVLGVYMCVSVDECILVTI